MARITRCVWNANGNELASIAKHGVDGNEVEEAILGVDGEPPQYMITRVGDFYEILSETGDGRLLSMVGELLAGNAIRVFHAMNMTPTEKAKFRKGTRR